MFYATEFFSAATALETYQWEVTLSTFKELFAGKYVQLNNEKDKKVKVDCQL